MSATLTTVNTDTITAEILDMMIYSTWYGARTVIDMSNGIGHPAGSRMRITNEILEVLLDDEKQYCMAHDGTVLRVWEHEKPSNGFIVKNITN